MNTWEGMLNIIVETFSIEMEHLNQRINTNVIKTKKIKMILKLNIKNKSYGT